MCLHEMWVLEVLDPRSSKLWQDVFASIISLDGRCEFFFLTAGLPFYSYIVLFPYGALRSTVGTNMTMLVEITVEQGHIQRLVYHLDPVL